MYYVLFVKCLYLKKQQMGRVGQRKPAPFARNFYSWRALAEFYRIALSARVDATASLVFHVIVSTTLIRDYYYSSCYWSGTHIAVYNPVDQM